jgi:hypothetical protein
MGGTMCLEKNHEELLFANAPKVHMAGILSHIDYKGRQIIRDVKLISVEDPEAEILQSNHCESLLKKVFKRISKSTYRPYTFSFLADTQNNGYVFRIGEKSARGLGIEPIIRGLSSQLVYNEVLKQLETILEIVDKDQF